MMTEDEYQAMIYEGVPDFYPPHLAKACKDPWKYRAVLRTGLTVTFEHATPYGEWVRLFGIEGSPYDAEMARIDAYWTERGVDVRVADIVLIADGGT